MHRLRTKTSRWILAVMMLVSIGSLVVTPVASEGLHRATISYSTWVRAQLRMPADAAIEKALEAAEASEARTPYAFVEAFVAAYEAEQPRQSLAGAFSGSDLSPEALVAYLQGRIARLVGHTLAPQMLWWSLPFPVNTGSDRFLVSMAEPASSTAHYSISALHLDDVLAVVQSLRVLSAAQPLGP